MQNLIRIWDNRFIYEFDVSMPTYSMIITQREHTERRSIILLQNFKNWRVKVRNEKNNKCVFTF